MSSLNGLRRLRPCSATNHRRRFLEVMGDLPGLGKEALEFLVQDVFRSFMGILLQHLRPTQQVFPCAATIYQTELCHFA